ncbi:pentapeptide repeat-containing protein [Paenibacillus sp. FSL R5-0749]|uniref:pentapeptide repeat-containing protein n=1 Tax=Paenibacillus sp. FSL R5-0749 TaxID=2921657 RepID=UPI00315A2C90
MVKLRCTFFYRISLFIILLFLLFPSSSYIHATNLKVSNVEEKNLSEIQKLNQETSKLKIESEKLREETEKIKREKGAIYWNPMLQMITSLIAIVSLLITYYATRNAHKNTINSMNIQTEKNEKDRISAMLKELGSGSIPVRIGAVQALGEYEISLRYIINVLKFDPIPAVREAAVIALQRFPELAIPLLAEESRHLHENQIMLAASHYIHEGDRERLINLFMLDKHEWINWHKNSFLNFKEDKENQWRIEQYTESLSEYSVKKRDKKHIIGEWKRCHQAIKELVQAMEKLINACTSSLEERTKNNIIIHSAYLPGIKLERMRLDNVVFEECIFHHSSFKESILNNVKFINCDLTDSNFTNSHSNKVELNNCRIDRTNYSKSSLVQSTFSECRGIDIRFNGAFLENVFIKKCTWAQARLYGMKVEKTNIYECELNKVTIGGNWKNINISKTSFQGCLFEKIIFENSVFADCTMRRLEWREGEGAHISFVSCYFKYSFITNIVSLDNIDMNNCSFDSQSDELKELFVSAFKPKKSSYMSRILSSITDSKHSPPR